MSHYFITAMSKVTLIKFHVSFDVISKVIFNLFITPDFMTDSAMQVHVIGCQCSGNVCVA